MKMRRIAPIAVFVTAFMLVTPTAWAFDHVSGVGQTRRSASLGFVATSDRTGEFQYTSESGAFSVHCTRYSSFESSETKKGYPKVELTARKCFRKNGKQRFLWAAFIDRGEPGIVLDIGRMRWSREWPVTPANTVRRDFGRIDAGNVQIL